MNDVSTADRSTYFARLALGCLLVLLGLWIASHFLAAFAWALVIAVAVDPFHMRLRARWRGARDRTWLAALGTSIIALLILVPLIAGVAQAALEAHDVAGWIASAHVNGLPVPDWVRQLPLGRDSIARWWQLNLSTPEAADRQFQYFHGATWLAHVRLIGSNLLHRLVVFAFTLLTLFFLLRDRDGIIGQCRRVGNRMFGPTADRVGRQAILSIRGTIDGLVLVGIGEGALMGVVYAVLGAPHPILLGALTAVAAMIPFGAALIFAVAAALLAAKGAVSAAIAVIVIGLTVVGIADHFIRPVLIGGATRLPFLFVLIGILGGVEMLGLLGLFIGPATMAVLVMFWRDFVEAPELGAGAAHDSAAD